MEVVSTWTCHICGSERLDKFISVISNDVSMDYNLMPGTMFENVRYCNDNSDCIDKSKTFRLTGKKK